VVAIAGSVRRHRFDRATLRQDQDDNVALYGRKLTNREIVTTGVHPPPAAGRLLLMLNKYSSRERKTVSSLE